MSIPGLGSLSCVHDWSYISASKAQGSAMVGRATAEAAMQVALYAANRDLAHRISNAQNDIADRQMKLAEAIHAHVQNFWPEEIEFVNDVFGEQKHEAQYDAQAMVWGELAKDAMDRGRKDWEREADALCVRIRPCDRNRWQRFQASTRADVASYAMRQEESKEQVLNDRRYARQLAAIGLGKDRIGVSATFTALSGASNIGATAMMAGAISSGLEALNYTMFRNREQDGWGEGLSVTLGRDTMGYNTGMKVNPAPLQVPNVQMEPTLLRPRSDVPMSKMEAADWED